MSTHFFVALFAEWVYSTRMADLTQPTVESLEYLAEILQDEHTELGPLDRKALLLLVQLFQYGMEDDSLCDDPDCDVCREAEARDNVK